MKNIVDLLYKLKIKKISSFYVPLRRQGSSAARHITKHLDGLRLYLLRNSRPLPSQGNTSIFYPRTYARGIVSFFVLIVFFFSSTFANTPAMWEIFTRDEYTAILGSANSSMLKGEQRQNFLTDLWDIAGKSDVPYPERLQNTYNKLISFVQTLQGRHQIGPVLERLKWEIYKVAPDSEIGKAARESDRQKADVIKVEKLKTLIAENAAQASEKILTSDQLQLLKTEGLISKVTFNNDVSDTQKQFFVAFMDKVQGKETMKLVYPEVTDPDTELSAADVITLSNILGETDLFEDEHIMLLTQTAVWAAYDKADMETGVEREGNVLKITDVAKFRAHTAALIKKTILNSFAEKPMDDKFRDKIVAFILKPFMSIFFFLDKGFLDSFAQGGEINKHPGFADHLALIITKINIPTLFEKPLMEDVTEPKGTEEVAEDTWPKKCGQTLLCHEPKLDDSDAPDMFKKALIGKEYAAMKGEEDKIMIPELKHYIDNYAMTGSLPGGLKPMIDGLKAQGYGDYSYSWVTAGIPVMGDYDDVQKATARCVEKIAETTLKVKKDGKEYDLPLERVFTKSQDYYAVYATKRTDKLTSTVSEGEQIRSKVFCGAIFSKTREDTGEKVDASSDVDPTSEAKSAKPISAAIPEKESWKVGTFYDDNATTDSYDKVDVDTLPYKGGDAYKGLGTSIKF